MIRTIYGKLSIILLGLFTLMGLVFILLALLSNHMFLQEMNQKLNRSVAKHLVTTRLLFDEGEVNKEALNEIYSDLMEVNPAIEVYLLDSYGHILSTSADKEDVKQDHISLEPVFRFLGERARFPIFGDDPVDPETRKIFSACPIPVSGPEEGYLYIVIGSGDMDSPLAMFRGSNIARLSVYAAVMGLLLVSLFGLFLFNHLTKRLRILTGKMESYKAGQTADDIDIALKDEDQGDEINRLGIAFSQMASQISEQMEKLRTSDSLRKELVSNVSHDLRTPLTSLQGYLETLRYKHDLTQEDRQHYLETALKHSDRLRRLVSDLFELSHLDADEVGIEQEAFSICELAQDVLQKFQLYAEERGILLLSEFDGQLPFVLADIGLMERALENLIKNAIQYTPKGGKITVSISQDGQSLVLQVRDTGNGIPEVDLPHIFDRYYRTQEKSSELPEGTGLGLAITKRIIELHGSTIDVQSTIGEGTRFTFRLPAVSSSGHECST
jgi:signal transduction histidine kinase